MKHRSSSRSRSAAPNAPTRPRRPRGSTAPRLLLGGLLAGALTAAVVAVPVISGAFEGVTPAAHRAPSSVTVSSEARARVATKPGRSAATKPAKTAVPPVDVEVPPAPSSTTTSSTSTSTSTSSTTASASPSTRASAAAPAPVATPEACNGAGRTTVAGSSVSPGPLDSQWQVRAPQADVTYDLTGLVSTAFPSTQHPFNTGTGTPGERTCLVGGELRGTVDPSRSWEWFHDEANAACVKVVALEWMQIHGTRCDGVEDGFRPQEGEPNSNRTRFTISGTYLSNVADDCLENDYILGGLLQDNLWESCFTGLSERPSGDRSWTPPADETLVLDRMLIGLRSMPHDSDKGTGPNALFKWSTSANKVVIKCSVFYVPAVSVNNTDTMAIPAGTVVDDSACPDNPTTIVWTGGGAYPAPTAGIRVVSDKGVWDRAVADWKTTHGY